MFLYVFKTGELKVVKDNPSIGDVLAVINGILTIVKHDGKNFFYLLVLDGESCWLKVEDAGILSCAEGRVHQ